MFVVTDQKKAERRMKASSPTEGHPMAKKAGLIGLALLGAVPAALVGSGQSVANASPEPSATVTPQRPRGLPVDLPLAVLPAPAEAHAYGLPADGFAHTTTVDLSNATLVRSLLASPSLSSVDREYLSHVPTYATFEQRAYRSTDPYQPGGVSALSQRGCGSGSGSWDCVYSMKGHCTDVLFRTTLSQFDAYEGATGNYKNVTNMSHPTNYIDHNFDWRPGTPSLDSGLTDYNTQGWMTANETFTFLKYGIQETYGYQLQVYSDSSFSSSQNITC